MIWSIVYLLFVIAAQCVQFVIYFNIIDIVLQLKQFNYMYTKTN